MKNISLFFSLFLAIGLFTTSCEDTVAKEQIAEQEAEYKKVMEGHDAVMPMTADLTRLIRQMKKYTKAHPEMTDEMKSNISKTMNKMAIAEDKMMAWMANSKNLKVLRMDKSHEEIMEHLKKENGIMDEIEKLSVEGVREGKELWESLQPQ